MSLTLVIAQKAERERQAKVKNDLFWLATEVLGYDKLTKEFHEPICKWFSGDSDQKLLLAARKHYKTTIQIADVIRMILVNPNSTQLLLHYVEDEVQKVVWECGNHFLNNKELRKIRPEIMPSPKTKRFLSASDFTVKRSSTTERQATVTGKGILSEITGMHIWTCIRPDDIIAEKAILDNQLPKVKNYWANTVKSVRMTGCKVRATGTRWDPADIYATWLKSPYWDCKVRAALETDGVPDKKGKSVLLPMKDLEHLMLPTDQDGMGTAFDFQMMNDPSPRGEKPWDPSACEHIIPFADTKGAGFIVVLVDPAPAKVGAWAQDKQRDDGAKDWWANAVVKFRAKGQRREIILLDGSASKDWGVEEGFTEVCRLARKWNTGYIAVEKTGQAVAFYEQTIRRTARREGIRYSPLELTMTYRGKNVQFEALASRARNDEFLISDAVPSEFLESFLEQARDWRPLAGGKNSLRFDDHANVVSFSTDPVFRRYTPVQEVHEWSPFMAPVEDDSQRFSRWISV
jgi:hypothetical protein